MSTVKFLEEENEKLKRDIGEEKKVSTHYIDAEKVASEKLRSKCIELATTVYEGKQLAKDLNKEKSNVVSMDKAIKDLEEKVEVLLKKLPKKNVRTKED